MSPGKGISIAKQQASRPGTAVGYHFGTFKGVYTPNLLTILGVIMYLRFGWVLGNVGLMPTLLIVSLSTAITLLTALSISALATNMKVGGGGAYYIISRSLGVEAGAAVGLPLFIAYSLGVSFYIVGFAESIVALAPELSPTLVGIITLLALTLLTLKSADLALKAQFLILILVGLSLVSLFAGQPPETLTVTHQTPIPAKEPFWAVFAIFFPAVTGILAGLAMSGDLKEPARSLPLGTLGAVLTSYVVYMVIPLFLGQMVPDDRLLRAHPLIMREIARWGDLILLGLWGATLSSAMGSLLGAPRMLQALARDDVAPRLLGRGYGRGRDPRLATLITFLIALSGILLGDLNLIAPILTMFFLTTYGLLNLSAALEGLVGSPSWRPAFPVHWGLSLLGTIGCFAVMFMINAGATLIAMLIVAGVYALMQRRSLQARWGDMRYGILTLLAEMIIYRLAQSQPDARTWKPNILVLSGTPTARWHLIALADAISHGQGLLTVATILPESGTTPERLDSVTATIADYLERRGIQALVKTQTAPDTYTGAQRLVDTYGFGPLVPNKILLGDTEKPEHFLAYADLIMRVSQTRRNLIIVREGEEPPEFDPTPGIDIWWGRTRNNAGLMLALAYLLQTSPEWEGSQLTLKTIVREQDEYDEAAKRLQAFIEDSRLEAEVEVLIQPAGEIFDTIRQASQQANLVLIGLREPEPEETPEVYRQYYQSLLDHTRDFPPTAIVLAAEEIEFQRIFR
jgi:amino acid transporter